MENKRDEERRIDEKYVGEIKPHIKLLKIPPFGIFLCSKLFNSTY
jgi:hypothetical protein